MIPILYDSTEVSFTSNGLGRLADCISCTVTEERNGIYECQFQYPITGEMYPLIQEGCILGVIHDDVKDIQPFDIYGRSAPLNGVVTFYAHHISYRLGNIILKPVSAPTCAAALNEIPNNTYTECPFTFWTDKSVSTAWKNEVPNPVKAILGGQQGSILDVYGKGEYEFDKWLVRLYVNRGVDNGVSIRYGVNLTDLQHDIDTSGAYTGVVPFWKSAEDDTVVTLTEGYVMVSVPQLVPLTENNGEEITDDQGRTIYLNAESSSTLLRTSVMDLSEAFEEQPTQEQLRAEALRRLSNSEAWLPSENIKVSFVDLAHTEEYKAVSALQRVRLCDWVSVYCGPLGVSAVSMQVIRVVFNVLNERYNEIELGKARTSFANALMADMNDTLSSTVEQAKSITAAAIEKATKQITGANGGHVRFVYDANGDPQEILIMDTEDIDTAVNVWRWNSGGLGFSSHGYAGPYSTAITADGQFVADFITTGGLTANILTSGVINGEYVKLKLMEVINELGDIIASFSDTVRLGLLNKAHAVLNFNSFVLYDKDDNGYLSLGDSRDINGRALVENTFLTDGVTDTFYLYDYTPIAWSPNTIQKVTIGGVETTRYSYLGYNLGHESIKMEYVPQRGEKLCIYFLTEDALYHYDLGNRESGSTTGRFSTINGERLTASGLRSHAEGYRTTASGDHSHSEGQLSIASGDVSHVEGNKTTASGWSAHAEGDQTNASASAAHAEGYKTNATSSYAHAEGYNTKATGQESHAEGSYTEARVVGCHAEGTGTVAAAPYQHVSGCYNIINDTSQGDSAYLLEIIGNGYADTTEHRSNARTLSKSGNEWIAGTLTQASDSRLKEESGVVPDVSSIRARRFRWNDKKIAHDEKDHIGYFAQDVEKVAPFLVDEDSNGYKSLDYIGLLCAKVEALERKVAELERR